MIVSEKKYTAIYNTLWRKWRKQKGSGNYQYLAQHGIEIFHLPSLNGQCHIELSTTWQKTEHGIVNTLHIVTYHYALATFTTRDFHTLVTED